MVQTSEHKEIGQRDAARLVVLRELYRLTRKPNGPECDEMLLLASCALMAHELEEAIDYLCGEGLMERLTEETVAITHAGVVEYEATVRSPGKSTEHFSSPVIFNVQGSVGAIVSGNRNTTTVQQVGQQFDASPEIEVKLTELARAVDGLSANDRATAAIVLADTRKEIARGTRDGWEKAELGLKFLEKYPALAVFIKAIWSLVRHQ